MKVPRLLECLTAIHRLLDVGIEVLDAHRDPIEPELAEQVGLVPRRDARIDLDRDLSIRLERESRGRRAPDPAYLIQSQVGRRAAAPVVLDHAGPLPEARAHQVDLALQVVQVGVGHARLLRDDDVAAAEGAALAAEGKVHVERERLLGGARRLVQLLEVALRREPLVKFDRGRIGRVARPRAIVLREERGGDLRGGPAHPTPPTGDR